jgi:hypothetical protein
MKLLDDIGLGEQISTETGTSETPKDLPVADCRFRECSAHPTENAHQRTRPIGDPSAGS